MSLARRLLTLVQANLGAWFHQRGGETNLDDFLDEEPDLSSRARSAPPPRPTRPLTAEMARLYAVLEVPVGADLQTIKSSFRRLMRAHHPDLHITDPERNRLATEQVQRLTQAYSELVRLLGAS